MTSKYEVNISIVDISFRLSRIHWDELENFLHQTEGGIKSEHEKFEQWFKKQTEGYTDEEVSEFIDYYYEDLEMIRDISPRLLRYSHITQIYGLYEYDVAGLCRALRRDKKTTVKPPTPLYTHGGRKYLIERAGFPKKAFGKSWNFMDGVRAIRNEITHAQGRIKKPDSKKFIKAQKLLSIDGAGMLQIESDEFAHIALNHARQAMSTLFAEVN